MNLYYTRSCNCNQSVIQELTRLNISYVALDIDEDANAGQHLYNVTHDLTVPALELEDGRFLIRPSVEELRALFAPETSREAAQKREQEQLLLQNQQRLAGLAAWGRYLSLVAIGCVSFWLGGLNPLHVDPAQSMWWMIGASVLLLVLTLAEKANLLKQLGGRLKKIIFYGLFFCMTYLMGLNFVFSQGQIHKQHATFSPVSVVSWLLVLGAVVWGGSLLLQLFKRLWVERQKLMKRAQMILGFLSMLGFAVSLFFVLVNHVPPPVEFTWFMLGILSLTLLVNLAFAVARMRSKNAIEKAGPVLYPAFAMLTLLVTILVSAK